jgi:ubiquitin-activating enzyme E1
MSDKMDVDTPDHQKVDENLYSRQLYVLGHETMRKMQTTHILLAGLGGLGVEVAKNIILMGVKAVTLYDPRPVSWDDLCTNFYASEADVGKPRADVVLPKLAELNQYVQVQVFKGELTDAVLKGFQVVCVTDTPLAEQLRINGITHGNGIKFVSADVRGVFARLFCDFGPEFTVTDTNGEAPLSYMLSAVEHDKDGKSLLTVLDEARIALEDGAKVTFTEVEGMVELNGKEAIVSKVLGPYTALIDLDTTGFSRYTGRGYIHEVKQDVKISFKSLEASLTEPDFLMSDFAKFEAPPALHVGFQALDKFLEKAGHYPRPHNDEDANAVIALAQELNNATFKVEPFPDGLIRQLAWGAQGSFVGTLAFS